MSTYSPSINLPPQPTLSGPEIAVVTSELFGRSISSEPLAGGSNPDIYRVDGTDGRGVVKFYPAGSGQAEFELYGMERAIDAGVPIPSPLRTGVLDVAGVERPWLAMDLASGRPMSERPLNFSEEEIVAGSVGRLLADFHSPSQPTPDGFWRQTGMQDGKPTWTYPTWSAYLANMHETLTNETGQLIAAGLSKGEIDAILRSTAEFQEMPPSRPILSYADLRREHVFTDDDLNVTSIIDWGSVQVAGREREFSKPFSNADEALVSAYVAASGCSREELDRRIRYLRIAHLPALAVFCIRHGWTQLAQTRVREVKQLLEQK